MTPIPIQFSVQLPSILIWLTALISISLGLVVLWGNRSTVSKAFANLMLWVAVWMVVQGLTHAAANQQLATELVKGEYFFGGVLAAAFFYFTLVFPESKKPKPIIPVLLVLSQLFLLAVYVFTNSITSEAILLGGYERWGWTYGSLYFLFDIFFYLYWVGGLLIVFRKYLKESENKLVKTRMKYMLIAMIVAISPTSILNILLPSLGYFTFEWIGVITVLAYVAVMAYSIVKYNQMDVKAIASEVLVIVMVVFLFVNIFANGSGFGTYGRVAIFLAFLIVGYYLIRSILREAKQKEELASLNLQLKDFNEHLQQKVEEQTKEIRQAYEVEKKARIELEQLDKNKDQFILATQHHLRTPLTIIKGYLQSLISSSSKESLEEAKPMLQRADIATDRLASLVSDLLDISQMQVGKSLLKKELLDPKPLIEEILKDMQGEIDRRHISQSVDLETIMLEVDLVRIKEVFTNLIDNAVKYCNEGGAIRIKGEKLNSIYRITIEDTGIGLTEAEKEHAFVEYFERGEEAQKVNTTGRGIGLVVTKNIVEAHGGKVCVESEGRGKGSRFIIELPVSTN